MSEQGWTVESMETALRRKGAVVRVAREALIQRARNFVADYGRSGGKTGRPDYGAMIPLDRIEALRIALDEYDRTEALDLERFRPDPQTEQP